MDILGHPERADVPIRSFDAWLGELETIMGLWHLQHGDLPYDLPLDRSADNGNVLCWRDSYDGGLTPQQAFDYDRTYWRD